jgi:hypothetical protein
MAAQHCQVDRSKGNVPSGSPAHQYCDLPMLADEEAFVACQHIDHLDLVANSGSRVLAVAALESCSHHVEVRGAFLVVWEALQRHLLESREHRQYRHHFRCQQAQARSDMPRRIL